MKLYIDEKGWPSSDLVTNDEIESLILRIQELEVSSKLIENFIDAVYDESLLPETTLFPETGNLKSHKKLRMNCSFTKKGSNSPLTSSWPIETERD
ncbi:hypothetical protein LINGRAHAP2_LOCUS7554 [Linum grandiflorum]